VLQLSDAASSITGDCGLGTCARHSLTGPFCATNGGNNPTCKDHETAKNACDTKTADGCCAVYNDAIKNEYKKTIITKKKQDDSDKAIQAGQSATTSGNGVTEKPKEGVPEKGGMPEKSENQMIKPRSWSALKKTSEGEAFNFYETEFQSASEAMKELWDAAVKDGCNPGVGKAPADVTAAFTFTGEASQDDMTLPFPVVKPYCHGLLGQTFGADGKQKSDDALQQYRSCCDRYDKDGVKKECEEAACTYDDQGAECEPIKPQKDDC
jgi:hypothetical protein